MDCAKKVELSIGIQTEKKLKQKTVSFAPPADGKGVRQRRLGFGGSGRRFRLIIESHGDIPWKLAGGMQIEAETDMD